MDMPTPALPTAVSPRDFNPGAGLPADRLAAVAARRAFVALKIAFAEAVADLEGPKGDWLQEQVRLAEEPIDLWLLRAVVFSALAGASPVRRLQRQRLRRALEVMFPDTQQTTSFATL